MKRISTIIIISTATLLHTALGAEKRVKMKDLPLAVQKAVQAQTKGIEVKGLSKEVESGKTFYEVETLVNGRGRDLLFDTNGTVVEVEEEVTLNGIPARAKAAIEKEAAGGEIKKVEMLTKGQSISYEAAIIKGGKKFEVEVKADGFPAK